MGFNVGANFPGYVRELGALRSAKGLAMMTAIPAVTVGAGAGVLTYTSTPERERTTDTLVRSIGIGAAAGAGAALLGLMTHRLAAAGPEIGTVAGRSSYQVGTGRFHQVPVQKPVYDNAGKQIGTVTVMEAQEIMETRWRNASGSLHANKLIGDSMGYASVDDARNAVGERGNTVGMRLDDDRVHLFTTKGQGPDVIERTTPTDPRVVFDT